MKLSIIYYSKGGNTRKAAGWIAEGMESIENVEVGIFGLEDIDYDFVKESKAVLFGTPTYYANLCWQMKKWFDESWGCNLEGKLGGAFATADYPQGGADVAIATILHHLMVKGLLLYSGGSALGQPYIHLGPIALKDSFGESEDLFYTFGKRIAQKAEQLFGKPSKS